MNTIYKLIQLIAILLFVCSIVIESHGQTDSMPKPPSPKTQMKLDIQHEAKYKLTAEQKERRAKLYEQFQQRFEGNSDSEEIRKAKEEVNSPDYIPGLPLPPPSLENEVQPTHYSKEDIVGSWTATWGTQLGIDMNITFIFHFDFPNGENTVQMLGTNAKDTRWSIQRDS